MNRVALFLNGLAPKILPELAQFEKIFCTDGAYLYLKENGIKPDVVSGDFDSINVTEIEQGIEIIETPDQNFTDFEKALNLIASYQYKEVFIYGSSGMEHDHFLGNLSSGLKFKDKLNLVFFDDYSFYFFAENQTILEDYMDRIISLYPFPMAEGITTDGLKFSLFNEDLDMTKRVGIRNLAVSNKVSISFKNGNLLVFVHN